MRAPGFWDDQETASGVSAEYSRAKRRLEEFGELEGRFADLESTEELLREELSGDSVDDELLEELVSGVTTLETDLQRGEEMRFFSGRYDEGGAIVTIHPGAGGTESQDWAEMLMRMYVRWAERHGFEVTVLDLLPGEEAGIKSVSIQIKGKYAYGYLKAEKGVHRLVRISPYDSQARRHTSFASVFVYPDVDDTIEIDLREEDIRMDVFGPRGPAASTSTRPRPPYGSPTRRPASWCPASRSGARPRTGPPP